MPRQEAVFWAERARYSSARVGAAAMRQVCEPSQAATVTAELQAKSVR